MAKTQAKIKVSYSLNAKAFAAKEQRRYEKAQYSPERKMELVQKLRDIGRELRAHSQIITRGKAEKG